jgi:hypothetical protein
MFAAACGSLDRYSGRQPTGSRSWKGTFCPAFRIKRKRLSGPVEADGAVDPAQSMHS